MVPLFLCLGDEMSSRVMLFVDNGNLWGSLSSHYSKIGKPKEKVDYDKLAGSLCARARAILAEEVTYEGTYLYGSLPPGEVPGRAPLSQQEREGRERQYRFFDRMKFIRGFIVRVSDRRRRWMECEHCRRRIDYTIEKGVDSNIVADILSLAWEDAYDVAIILSDDADLVPAAEFLPRKGKKVIHASFESLGRGKRLRKVCFGSISIESCLPEITSRT